MSNLFDQALSGNAKAFDDARQLGALSMVLEGHSPADSVFAMDKTLFTLREAVDVANGKTSGQDAVENMIDRATVYVVTWAQTQCVKLCESGGEKLGSAIGEIFGPQGAAIGAVAGKAVGRAIGVALKPIVEKGVLMISDCVKSLWEGVKNITSGLFGGII